MYQFSNQDDERYARRMSRSGNPFPPKLIIGVVVLFIAFVLIGIFALGNDNTDSTPTLDESAIVDQKVNETLASMTTEEKVAQLFFVTPEQIAGTSPVTVADESTRTGLSAYPVGGIVYSSANVESEEQLKTLLSTTSSFSKYPLFLGTSEVGGEYTAIASTGLIPSATATSNPQAVGATGDSSNAYTLGHTIGSYLANLGFNVDFGVRCDLSATNPKSFSADKTVASDMVTKEVSGLKGTGVSPVLQFFPGEGVFETDPDLGVTSTDATLEQLQSNELVPFQSGIDAGAEFVMVTDGCYPAISGNDVPATLSDSVINGVLRQQLGYDGIVISCPMDTATITSQYSSGEAAVIFINAGGDMIYRPADFPEAYSTVLMAVNDGTISQERLDQSVTRILKVKYSD